MFIAHKKTYRSGFSLIEVLVAISLLLIALVGPMTFFARNSQSTEIANDRAIATFLAQEGAELIQKIRDDRTLEFFFTSDNDGWSEFLSDVSACTSGNRCGVYIDDSANINVVSCTDITNCRLNYDTSVTRSRYNHSSGEVSPFTRTIELDAIGNREVEITSRVEWDSTALIDSQSVEVQTSVFNVFINN